MVYLHSYRSYRWSKICFFQYNSSSTEKWISPIISTCSTQVEYTYYLLGTVASFFFFLFSFFFLPFSDLTYFNYLKQNMLLMLTSLIMKIVYLLLCNPFKGVMMSCPIKIIMLQLIVWYRSINASSCKCIVNVNHRCRLFQHSWLNNHWSWTRKILFEYLMIQ